MNVFNTTFCYMLENKKDIKKRLKQARLKFGLSSTAFAKKAGINPNNYSSIESGDRTIGLRLLREISQAHGVRIEWLTTGEGPMMQGDIDASGNQGVIGNVGGAGNTAHMTVNAYGYQKIIHPDGRIELIPYQPGEQGHPMPVEQIIGEYNTLQLEKVSWENERKRLNTLLDSYQKLVASLQGGSSVMKK